MNRKESTTVGLVMASGPSGSGPKLEIPQPWTELGGPRDGCLRSRRSQAATFSAGDPIGAVVHGAAWNTYIWRQEASWETDTDDVARMLKANHRYRCRLMRASCGGPAAANGSKPEADPRAGSAVRATRTLGATFLTPSTSSAIAD